MSDRTCPKCNCRFSYPSVLKKHLQRKTPCTAIIGPSEQNVDKPHLCRFCGRCFTTIQGVSRHIREACKIAGSEKGMELLYEHTLKKQLKKQDEKTRLVEAEIAELKAQMKQLTVTQPIPQTMVNNINSGVQQNNIVINVFGQESTAHVNRSSIKGLLDGVLQQSMSPVQSAIAALLKTAMLIYSDPARPENLTCYLPNKKKDDVMVHGDEGWEIQPCTLALPPMVTKSMDTLFANQPFEEADKYGDLMRVLRANEAAYKEGKEMKMVLIRNKDLLEKALGNLPR